MREVICSTSFEYPPGKLHLPGDRVPMEDDHVFLFRNAGKIELEDAPPPQVARVSEQAHDETGGETASESESATATTPTRDDGATPRGAKAAAAAERKKAQRQDA